MPEHHDEHPPDAPPSPSGLLVTAMVLAAVAGCLDAHLFLNVTEVFVANQSGNVVLLGMYVGKQQWDAAGGAATALLAFGIGVVGATLLHLHWEDEHRDVRPDAILGAETVLLVALALWLAWAHPDQQPTPSPGHYPLLLLGGIAMGLQTVVLGRVGSISVATTYESGSVVRLGQEAVMVRRSPSADRRRHHLAVLRVLGCVVGSYSAGAALAAALGAEPLLLLLPAASLLVVSSLTHVSVRRRIAALRQEL